VGPLRTQFESYEFLFTATPIRLGGSTGAPAHPLAIF
jgi:hypothetical protein